MQKISKHKTATAYALAWFEVARDKKFETKVFNEVELLKSSVEKDPDLWKLLAAPVNKIEDVKVIVSDLADKMKLSEISRNTLGLIAENKRIGLLDAILSEFEKIYYQNNGVTNVFVDTVVELSQEQDLKLKDVLEKKLGSSVIVHYALKPEVLGGLAVRVGSTLFDDTISTKLNKIEKSLKGQKIVL